MPLVRKGVESNIRTRVIGWYVIDRFSMTPPEWPKTAELDRLQIGLAPAPTLRQQHTMKHSGQQFDFPLDLLDPRLFGNEAGDDEDEATLSEYFVDKPEFKSFEANSRRIAICRGRKGMGKSALLNYISYSKSQLPNTYVSKVKGSDLFSRLKEGIVDSHEWVASWRQVIIDVVNASLNLDLGVDSRTAASVFSISNGTRFSLANADGLIWLCIDDIDATYRRSISEDLRLAAFFSAVRGLAVEFPLLRIRVSVRQDVWSSIRAVDEALDKCEQYMLDIEWSRTGTRSIIAKRIKHYVALLHTEARAAIHGTVVDAPDEEAKRAINQLSDPKALLILFPAKYPWGSFTTDVHNVIHVLSAGRPRWALQLARMTAGIAAKYGDHLLKYGYMKQILPRYSQSRIIDLIREHSHQCPQIEDLLYSFNSTDRELTTQEFIERVDKRIHAKVDVFIDRDTNKASVIEICQFMFRIGFIEAIDLNDRTRHYHFEDSPQLLRSMTAVHDHIKWQVRPSYQAALA